MLLGLGDGIGARREHAVHRLHLFGVDAELALEAEAERGVRRALQVVCVREIDEDRVDGRLQPAHAGGQHDRRARVRKLGFGPGPDHSHVARVIARAEGEPADARARAGDRLGRSDALAGLDDRHEVDGALREPPLALKLAEQPVRRLKLAGRLDLGQHDAVHACRDDGLEVAVAVVGVEPVHAHVAEAGARRLQGLHHDRPCRFLLRRGDGVLEVEDHGVGAGAEYLGDLARMVAGGEQIGAVQLHGNSLRLGPNNHSPPPRSRRPAPAAGWLCPREFRRSCGSGALFVSLLWKSQRKLVCFPQYRLCPGKEDCRLILWIDLRTTFMSTRAMAWTGSRRHVRGQR